MQYENKWNKVVFYFCFFNFSLFAFFFSFFLSLPLFEYYICIYIQYTWFSFYSILFYFISFYFISLRPLRTIDVEAPHLFSLAVLALLLRVYFF